MHLESANRNHPHSEQVTDRIADLDNDPKYYKALDFEIKKEQTF